MVVWTVVWLLESELAGWVDFDNPSVGRLGLVRSGG
jgi:hypothetical protein